MPGSQKRVREIIPEIRKYMTQKTGGAEVIRSLRDTLGPLGLKYRSRNVPYRHQRVLWERADQEREENRQTLHDQGIFLRRSYKGSKGGTKGAKSAWKARK